MNYRIAVLFIVVGVSVCYFVGYREFRHGRTASATPEPMTVRQLIDRGPAGNPYLDLTNFRLLTDEGDYVVQVDAYTHAWQVVYAVAVPADGPQPPTPVVVRSTHLPNPDAVQELGQRPALRGMAGDELGRLPDKARDALSKRYPGVDFANCVGFEEGATPTGLRRAVAVCAGGLAFFAVGVLALWRLRRGTA